MVAQIDMKFARSRPWKLWSRLMAYLVFEGRPLTTRGRWINPLVFAGYRLWSVLPFRNREHRPIFILGVGRSGTTILGIILALHPDVGYLNEPKALWQAALGDDDLIGSYGRQPGRYRMGAADAGAGRSRRLRRFYSAFLGLSASRRVVDKYPELLFRNGLLGAVFPKARKIVLIRNGADICQSIHVWSERNGDDHANWWGRNGQKWQALVDQLVAPDELFRANISQVRELHRNVDRAAVEWIVTMREALALQDADEHMMLVRFERLVAQPRETLQDILDFCGLRQDRKMLTYGERTLRIPKGYSAPELSPCIAPLFAATMVALGYKAGSHP